MKPNEAADHEWIRQRKARQKNSTKEKKGYFSVLRRFMYRIKYTV